MTGSIGFSLVVAGLIILWVTFAFDDLVQERALHPEPIIIPIGILGGFGAVVLGLALLALSGML